MASRTIVFAVVISAMMTVHRIECHNTTENRQTAETAIAGLLLDFTSSDVASSKQGDSYLTQEDLVPFLTYVTKHSESFVNKFLGDTCEETSNGSCSWKAECPGTKELFQQHGSANGRLYPSDLVELLPRALYSLTATNCTHGASDGTDKTSHRRKPSTAEAWGYGIGFVTSVVIISNIGACLGTCMEKRFFKRFLQFLVAMGAGSLASTGMLVLIPESFDLMSIEELGDSYVWKSTVAIISIYVFFSAERLLKTFLSNKKRRNQDVSITVDGSSSGDAREKLTIQDMKEISSNSNGEPHGHSHGDFDSEDRTTLAYMVMAGDIIHNFVDGLSIGAAFTDRITVGISVSLAVLCEELPHELADIAILLHSGLSLKKAVFINFISACVCYLGLIIGVLLGMTIGEASKWIFAIAGGLFLYVPLVDMLPDMSNHLDELLRTRKGEARIVACLHILGLLIGATIIVFIVNISTYIAID